MDNKSLEIKRVFDFQQQEFPLVVKESRRILSAARNSN